MSDETDQPLTSWPRRLLSEHPAFLFSSIYVAASIVGMAFSWDYLRRFGINVFLYAEISDFMLASLKEPVTWAYVLTAIVIVGSDNAMSEWASRKTSSRWLRWYTSPRYRAINYLAGLVIFVLLVHLYAINKAKAMYEGEGEAVSVELTDGSPPKEALLLGTTAKFLFLYQPQHDQVDIHPNEAVLMIRKVGVSGESKEED